MCFDLRADDNEQRRKRAGRSALTGLLLFAPWKKLRPQIAVAAHDFDDYFDAVDAALETHSLTKALKSGSSIVPSMTRLIRAAMIGGFEDGGALVGKRPGRNYAARAGQQAADRAQEASALMIGTSKKWLKSDPNHSYALSQDRAERAARYEAAQAYYTGLHQALWGEGMMKQWTTTSEAPCEDCIEDEDEGPIEMEAVFPSGDSAPLAHPNCQCILEIIRPEDL